MDEAAYWRKLILDLQDKFTLEFLAQHFNVSIRQVSNWKTGDRPRGMTAIRIYLFHVKHRTEVQAVSTGVHGLEEG